MLHRDSLTAPGDLPRLFRRATELLGDPAGPAPDAAMTALRTQLRKEPEALKSCLELMFEKMEVGKSSHRAHMPVACQLGGRLVLLLDRRDFAMPIRLWFRRHEAARADFGLLPINFKAYVYLSNGQDYDPEVVKGWRPSKVAQLFPNRRPWCLRGP